MMAATSLAEQLKSLAVPQTTIYREDSKKPSLLFDPKDAALKDRDTFYEIGNSGLRELIALYEGFRYYEDSLFSLSSKDFERAIESREVNDNLNLTIEKFLLHLSPYLMLQSAHKALEWLVNRYQIQKYNEDGIMALILPYHETKIFVRFIQIMDLKTSSRWHWLKPLKKPGITLTKQVLFNQCVSNQATLQFIASTTMRYITEFGDRATQLNTVLAFFCSTAVGAMHNVKKVGEPLLNALLPTVMNAIESPILDFRSSAYIIIGFLTTKASLKPKTHNKIVHKLITTEFDVNYDIVMLINLMYTNQEHINKISNDVISDITVEVMNIICMHLKKLIENNISVQRFLVVFLRSLLLKIQHDGEEFIMYHRLPEMLIEEVDFKAQDPEALIKCVIDSFQTKRLDQDAEDDGSDIEIIEEDGFAAKIFTWYSEYLRNLEVKYPQTFDKVIKQEMSSNSNLSKIRKKQLSKILGFKPAIAHKLGDNYLFENLNHVNPDLRAEAVHYISKEFEILKIENPEFLKESISTRLKDDNIGVVKAALNLPIEQLTEVLNEIDLTNILVGIVVKKSLKWQPVIEEAICKFCSLKVLPVNQDTVLALIPYLFPNNADSAKIAWHIINSAWGQKVDFIRNLKDMSNIKLQDNYKVIMKRVFNALFEQRTANFNNVLDINLLNKNNTIDICTFLMLKLCSFKSVGVTELSDILNLLLEAVEKRSVVSSTESDKFSTELMPELIEATKNDQILFEFMSYIFTRIIEDMTVMKIPKPWCNILANPELVLIKRLYEICLTGCSIPTYSENYAKLLQKLLQKICLTPRERCEFIANIAFGHILYATDPKDVISPELQLRSLKLLKNFIAVQENETWLYDSDVIMLMILFDLNHPLAAVRQSIVEVINNILREDPDEKSIYIKLIKELMTHSEELLLDHEQILQVLNTILTGPNTNKIFKKNCLLKLTSILISDTPAHIKSSLLEILDNFNNANTFTKVVSALSYLENTIKSNDPSNNVFDCYESNIMKNVYSHINETTASVFVNEEVWKSIKYGLGQYKECILEDGHSYTSPCNLIMKQITEDVFKKIPKEKTKEVLTLITAAGTFSGNPNISSLASKVIRKIHIDYKDFKGILENMLNVVDPAANVPKKKKSSVSMLSHQITETEEWRLGVTLLEFVQTKKKMSVNNGFVQILFQLLNKCLRFEEQSYVEYTKQLILSSLWYFCKKFVDDSDGDQVKNLKSLFNVELVVQCIRGTQNPQTHHHALILLSHAAYMLPEQVLHHTMEIFTFMGSSVLRHDDGYSFQIITKIIETLVPILVKLDNQIEHSSPMELLQLRSRVVPVLRIFADVVLHVPEHRRLPLYKKLIETLGPNHFLWVLIALLLEAHISHFNENKDKKDKRETRTLADQESPVNRLDFGQSILLEFPPEVGLHNLIQLILYLKNLPLQKDEDAMETDIDPKEIFSVKGHSALQLRHYKYIIITFMNTCLSSSRFIQHASLATNTKDMETNYKTFIINVLTFIQSISKINDDKTAKYWRVMLHYSYDLLDNTNNLLSAPMFVSVVRGLLRHDLPTVRRKAMELLNNKIQFNPEIIEKVDNNLIFSLLPELLNVVASAETKDESLTEVAVQELELNQQTALLSLKLLTKLLAEENPEPFKPVLEQITQYTCNLSIPGNVMASVVLCLAELCSNLKAHALASLRKFMPALIKVLKKQRQSETPELVLLSTVTAISKIIESLPLFLSPYLQKILFEYSILLAKWLAHDQECSKVSAIVTKLTNIKKKIAGSIPPRVLIPVANETHQLLLEKENYSAIGPVMSVLADTFANITTADFTALRQDLTTFFINALQLRSDAVEKDISPDVIDKAEDEIVNALVCLVLKLSETSFRPFYFKIYDWAIRTNVEGHKDRVITFYRLSAAIADKLKGLFVLFAGHFMKNAAELLDASNNTKSEDLYFDTEDKCILLIKYIIKTLHIVFLYDSQSFLNKDRFETLMQPIVDQLENTLGGVESLKTRAVESLIPCIAQCAVATADDSLWKLLNYQILLKTRHNDAEIRLLALDCLVAMASQLGTSWLPLLAESVPFLAELLEDGDAKIETSTKDAIRKLEQILEEPLEKYF